MSLFKRAVPTLGMVALVGCGNPGDISDDDYAKYKALAAPKILYSCTGGGMLVGEQMVGYVAGVGLGSTYNKLLRDIESECSSKSGKLKVLKSEK